LQLEGKDFRQARSGRWAVAVLLIAPFLASLLLAAVPALHERFHEDASQPLHHCAVTIFQQEHFATSNPSVALVCLNSGRVLSAADVSMLAFLDHASRFSPSRAPPALFLPLV